MNPVAADAIRKVVGYALATILTLLLFRIFGRLSNGREALLDPELGVFVGLAALAVVWVRAARRVRRAAPPAPTNDPNAPAVTDDRDAFR